ncbi:MAG: hypothetical protein ACI8UD_000021 [Planctomycetota bacterium]|jgi:hypothetical protein
MRAEKIFAFEHDDAWLHKNQRALDRARQTYDGGDGNLRNP